MGPDTEERIKAISANAAREAAQEAARLVYEQFYPVMVRREQRGDSLLKIVIDTMKHFIGQVEIRLLKK